MPIRVRPAEGRRVRDPKTKRVLPPAGIVVSETDPFWHRRIRDKDVVVVPIDAPAPAAAPAAPAATAPVATPAAAPAKVITDSTASADATAAKAGQAKE